MNFAESKSLTALYSFLFLCRDSGVNHCSHCLTLCKSVRLDLSEFVAGDADVVIPDLVYGKPLLIPDNIDMIPLGWLSA